MIQRLIMCVCAVLMLASCAHAPAKEETKRKMFKTKNAVEEKVASVTGSVLDREVLAQGGDIALVPFKAGPQAEATEELDRLSMMIIKGIKDSLNAQKKSLHVVDPSEAQPKIALQGYIEEYSKTGRMKRMMLRPNENSIRLAGEVWLISTGQRLLSFETDKRFEPKKEKAINVAYELGKEIGEYIGSYAQ